MQTSQGLQAGAWVVVLKDLLQPPTPLGQVHGPRLGESGTMAKAATFEQPLPWRHLLDHKQRAGQLAQGAPDGIEMEHPLTPLAHDLQSQHPTTGTPPQNDNLLGLTQLGGLGRHSLGDLGRIKAARPTKTGMVSPVGRSAMGQEVVNPSGRQGQWKAPHEGLGPRAGRINGRLEVGQPSTAPGLLKAS